MSSEDDRQPSDQAEEAKGDYVWKRTKEGSATRLVPAGIAVGSGSGWTTRGTRAY